MLTESLYQVFVVGGEAESPTIMRVLEGGERTYEGLDEDGPDGGCNHEQG